MGKEAVHNQFTVVTRPIDKRENYIKRCVGLPGDVIAMEGAKLMVNGQPGFTPPEMQMDYYVYTDQSGLNPERMKDLRLEYYPTNQPDIFRVFMTADEAEVVKAWGNVKSVEMGTLDKSQLLGDTYPHDNHYRWNFDNFGPITIPAKGWTVSLDSLSVPMYARAIRDYEGNTLEKRGDGYYINGQKSATYTFKQNYYWMVGDNRHNSLDSRAWGFVPEDHIVGKALFTWMSYDENGSFLSKIRWNRIFKGIN